MGTRVVYETRDGIGWLFFEGSPVVFSTRVVAEALKALSALEEESRVVVVSSKGKLFSAGVDLREVDAASTPEEASRPFEALALLYEKLASLRVPVVLALNGDAYGGGAELVWAADVVLAVRGAKLVWAEAQWGLVPPVGVVLGSAALGIHRALRHMMLLEPLAAEEAEKLGIVYRVVDSVEELYTEAEAVAKRIASLPPEPLSIMRRLARLAWSQALGAGIAELARTARSSVLRERVRDFFAKKR